MRDRTRNLLRWLHVRALALLVVVLVIGLVTTGTHALWTGDEATATTGTFTAGTVDLGAGPDAVHEYTVAIPDAELWPGDTRSVPVRLTNTGSLPIDFSTSVSTTGDLGPALRVSGVPASGSLAPAQSTDLTLSITFDASRITAPSGAGSFQGAQGAVTITFDAQNQEQTP